MKTPKALRRIGFILTLAAFAAAPLSVRAEDPIDVILQWMGYGTPPPAPMEGGPGSCPVGGC